MTRDHEPAGCPAQGRDRTADRADARVGGILLAAGQSRRFGPENKLLAPLEGDPLVAHAARTLLAADLEEIVVIVGHEAERVRASLVDVRREPEPEVDLTIRENPDYAEGQSRSVRLGAIEATRRGWDGALFALGDMPFVAVETIDRLLAAYAADAGSILAPSIDGQRGNPVLFDAIHFETLASVDGDRGGRQLLETHEDAALVPVDDDGIRRDIDDRHDLESLE